MFLTTPIPNLWSSNAHRRATVDTRRSHRQTSLAVAIVQLAILFPYFYFNFYIHPMLQESRLVEPLELNGETIDGNVMGAQKSIHVGKAKIDVNVDFTHKLCAGLMFQPLRNSGSPFELVIGSLCIKHPDLFGKSEKLDVVWDKVSPEIGIQGIPVDNFSRSESGGVNLCRFSAGLDLSEPASSNCSSKTSIRFEHVRPVNDDGWPISRDLHGFPVTCSGGYHDNMVVLKQESRFARLSLQIEQGVPFLSKWLIFNPFKFVASKGVKLGPAFLLTRLTGGSTVGDIATYQAFAIGGLKSVRGYGEE